MKTHRFAIIMLGADVEMMTSDSEQQCHSWLRFKGAVINMPGSSVFKTEDGVEYMLKLKFTPGEKWHAT